jgi:hypothetical protein
VNPVENHSLSTFSVLRTNFLPFHSHVRAALGSSFLNRRKHWGRVLYSQIWR